MKELVGCEQELRHAIAQLDYDAIRSMVLEADIPDAFKNAIVEDLLESKRTGCASSQRCKDIINSLDSNWIYGVFSARYFPSLSIDGVEYERLPLPSYAGMKLGSPVVPIKIRSATNGFNDRSVVALFPENHLDQIQKSTDKVFYFIDKFVERHLNRTRIIMDRFTTPVSFQSAKQLTTDEVEEYSIHWVWLHEYFHRVGPLPLPEYLDIKSYRPLAGLEECRVDMEAICFIHGCDLIPKDTKEKLSEFILSERILRYSVEGIPNPNYDAIGSQVLVNYLIRLGYIEIQSDTLQVSSNYIDGIKHFVTAISKIEQNIETCTKDQVRDLLIAFVNSNLNLAYDSKQYSHDPFFMMVRDNLQ